MESLDPYAECSYNIIDVENYPLTSTATMENSVEIP